MVSRRLFPGGAASAPPPLARRVHVASRVSEVSRFEPCQGGRVGDSGRLLRLGGSFRVLGGIDNPSVEKVPEMVSRRVGPLVRSPQLPSRRSRRFDDFSLGGTLVPPLSPAWVGRRTRLSRGNPRRRRCVRGLSLEPFHHGLDDLGFSPVPPAHLCNGEGRKPPRSDGRPRGFGFRSHSSDISTGKIGTDMGPSGRAGTDCRPVGMDLRRAE